MGDVYQWLCELEDKEVRVTAIVREYDNRVATDGVEFDDSTWLLELILRRILESEVQTTLSVLETQEKEERRKVYAELIRRSEEQQADLFIDRFDAYVPSGRKRGHVYLEPHSADKSEPTLTVSGATFPNQGNPAARRMRLMVQRDRMFVPLMLTTSDGVFDADRKREGDDDAMAWTDLRLLGGSLTEVSRGVVDILSALPNMLLESIQIGLTGSFPTILTKEDLARFDAIAPLGQLALACEPAALLINKLIAERRVQTQSQVSLAAVFALLDAIPDPVIARRLKSLETDPVLFVKGPVLKNSQSMNTGDVKVGTAFINERRTILPGFRFEDMFKRYETDYAFSTESTEAYTNINTLTNLMNGPPWMVVRVSDWFNALETSSVVHAEVPEVAGDSGASVTSQRWMSDVVKPHIEKQFRAHLVTPRNSTEGLEMDVGVDVAGRYAAFEAVIHDGDVNEYIRESISVVRMALGMLFVKAAEAGGGHVNKVPVEKLYDDSELDLFDRFIPVIRRVSNREVDGETVDVRSEGHVSTIQTQWGTSGISACSQFLYKHVAIAMKMPMKAAFPTHREVSSFLSKSVPFPVTNPKLKRQIDDMTKRVEASMRRKFEGALHFHRIDPRYARNVITNQPFSIPFCHMKQTTSEDGLEYSSGSEATKVIEALMLSIHLVNAMTREKGRHKTVFQPDTVEPIPVNIHQKDIACKAESLRARATVPATQIRDGLKTVDATRYAAYLGLTTPDSMNQAGNAVFTGVRNAPRAPAEGVVGCFRVVKSSSSVTDVSEKSWFKYVQTHAYEATYTLYESASDARTITLANLETQDALHAWRIKMDGMELPDDGDVEDRTFNDALFKDLYSLPGGMYDFGGLCVPLRQTGKTDVVGYAKFSTIQVNIYDNDGKRGIVVDWAKTKLSQVFCLLRGCVRKVGMTPSGTSMWAFSYDVECGLSQTGAWLTISGGVPILRASEIDTVILEGTAKRLADTRTPFRFREARATMNTEDIVRMLSNGFTGLHYSTTAAAPYTSFAVIVGNTRDGVVRSLKQIDSRFGDAWAVDSNDGSDIAKVLRTLYYEFTRSTTRHTDTPMVETVEMHVKGPGAGAETTMCTVSGKGVYLYRTDHYGMIETIMMGRLRTTVDQAFSAPGYDRGLGSDMRVRRNRYRGIRDILAATRDGGSAVARLMLSLNIEDKLDKETSRPRDKRTIDNFRKNIQEYVSAVLNLQLR